MNILTMKPGPALVLFAEVCAAGLIGCDDSGNQQKQLAQQRAHAQYQQQMDRVELENKRHDDLLAKSEEQSRRADELDNRYEALVAKWEEQARRADDLDARYKALLARWEAQAQRVDALLDRAASAAATRPAAE